ncbi:hypothetical protein [Streptomyces sp. NPDC058272]|uniref:hypothetical protein n=1 Tax=Streptomyces sp. NPDC058272 TaxID=3346415 RepID=UPI0036EB92EB
MDFTINCKYGDPSDRLEVKRDYDGDIRLYMPTTAVYVDDAEARDFARQLLALAGDGAESAAIKVGDRVEITKYRSDDRAHVGRFGTVTEIDTDHIPYLVHVDGYGGVWAMEVRKVAPAPEPSTFGGRASVLEEARRIAGPGASAADVLAYAKFLSE